MLMLTGLDAGQPAGFPQIQPQTSWFGKDEAVLSGLVQLCAVLSIALPPVDVYDLYTVLLMVASRETREGGE